MNDISTIMVAAFCALVIDRFVLEPRIGHFFETVKPSTYRTALFLGCTVLFMTTISSVIAALLAQFILIPLNQPYLIIIVFIVSIILTSIGLEVLLSRWMAVDLANRLFARAALICSILGTITLVPLLVSTQKDDVVFLSVMMHGCGVGSMFAASSLFIQGIRKRIAITGPKQGTSALAIELLMLGLIMLVFSWCKGM